MKKLLFIITLLLISSLRLDAQILSIHEMCTMYNNYEYSEVNKKLLSLGFKKDKSNQAGDMTLNTYLYRVGIGQGMDLFATEKWISTKNLNFVYYIDTKNEIYSSVVADIENEGFAFINQSVFNDVLFDIYWKPKQDFVIGIKSETDDNNSYTPYKTTIRLISGK